VSYDLDYVDVVLSEAGPRLLEYAKAGTILDAVLRYQEVGNTVTLAPIIHSYFDILHNQLTVSWIYETEIMSGTYTQE